MRTSQPYANDRKKSNSEFYEFTRGGISDDLTERVKHLCKKLEEEENGITLNSKKDYDIMYADMMLYEFLRHHTVPEFMRDEVMYEKNRNALDDFKSSISRAYSRYVTRFMFKLLPPILVILIIILKVVLKVI